MVCLLIAFGIFLIAVGVAFIMELRRKKHDHIKEQ